MPADTWLQISRNAAIATTGAPRSSHSCRMCARGSSPRQMATMGLRNPSPTSDSTRMAASMAAATRGRRGPAAMGCLAGMGGAGAPLNGGASNAFGLLADDISVLDLLLALQSQRQLLDVGIRL